MQHNRNTAELLSMPRGNAVCMNDYALLRQANFVTSSASCTGSHKVRTACQRKLEWEHILHNISFRLARCAYMQCFDQGWLGRVCLLSEYALMSSLYSIAQHHVLCEHCVPEH